MAGDLRFGQSRQRESFREFVFARPSWIGSLVGLLFLWLSLAPSLLPRPWMTQGLVGAISIAFGYGVGSFLGWVIRYFRHRSGRPEIGGRTMSRARVAFWGLFAVLVAAAIVLWPVWQNEQRELVGMDLIASVVILYAIGLSLAVSAVLIVIGRMLAFVIRGLDRWFARRLPKPVVYAFLVLIVAGTGYLFTIDVVFNGFIAWANDRYETADQGTYPGDVQPTSSLKSGSPDSLVAWDSVGREGRAFLANASTPEDIEGFTGQAAVEPIRVYAGLNSADSPGDRAELVVEELRRTGGFERGHLVVVATTGTGWVDPDAAHVAEYMYGGDTAIAAIQYSFLPSWISFLVDSEKSAAAGSAIFDAVVGEWERLPDATRPILVLFGEGLGSFGAEAAVGGGNLEQSVLEAERADGVILLGPTNQNILWQQLISNRNPATPVWKPHSVSHPELVVANLVGEVAPAQVGPGLGHILYYHHPSDPIGYWNWETLWKSQEWTSDPIGYDVSPATRWYPFVTFWQVVFDLIAGFSAPSGFGNNYSVDMPDAWAAVAAPDDWTVADSDRLRHHLDLG